MTKLNLGKVDYEGRGAVNAVTLELELRDHKGTTEVSIVGAVWNSRGTDWRTGGQCRDTIRELFPNDTKVQRICDLWDRWHLNTMRAGTPAQTKAVEAWLAEGHRYEYTAVCEHLKAIGLYDDNGYKYGHAWLTEVVPEEVLTELRTLFHVL